MSTSNNQPFWNTFLNSIFIIGAFIYIIKCLRKKSNNSENNMEITQCSEDSGNMNGYGSGRGYFILLWLVIVIVFITGAALYIIASYPRPISDDFTSTGNFQANTSDNFSVSGDFNIQQKEFPVDSTNASFDLAIISGVLGGFALTVMVARLTSGPVSLKYNLLFQGIFYVLATIAFVIFGFYFAADKARLLENLTQLVPVYVVSFFAGTLFLATGASFTIWAIIRLPRKRWWRNVRLYFNRAIDGD